MFFEHLARHGGPSENSGFDPSKMFLWVSSTNESSFSLEILDSLANFINSELYGKTSEVLWSVTFTKVDNLPRHPSQLYEAVLEGAILFLILMYFRKKNYLTKPGLISGLFLIFYSIFRIFVEFYRVPDEQIGYLAFNLSVVQIINLVFLIIGTIIFFLKNENR